MLHSTPEMKQLAHLMRQVELLQRNRIIQPGQRRITTIHQFRPARKGIFPGVHAPAPKTPRAQSNTAWSEAGARAGGHCLSYRILVWLLIRARGSMERIYRVEGGAQKGDVVGSRVAFLVYEAVDVWQVSECGQPVVLAVGRDINRVIVGERQLARALDCCNWGKDNVSCEGS